MLISTLAVTASAQLDLPIFLPIVQSATNTVRTASQVSDEMPSPPGPTPSDEALLPTEPNPEGLAKVIQEAQEMELEIGEPVMFMGPETAGKYIEFDDGSSLQLPDDIFVESYTTSGLCASVFDPELDVYCPSHPIVSLQRLGEETFGISIELSNKQLLASPMFPIEERMAKSLEYPEIIEQIGAETILIDDKIVPIGVAK